MATILLRIGLTPVAFALVSRAQSRFGDWIGGRLIGLPLTTGPFLLAVCATSSRETAARAAAGVTGGQISVVVFCAAYAWMARRLRPLQATFVSLAVALAAMAALDSVAGQWSAAVVVWLVIAGTLMLWPWPREEAAPATGIESPTPAPVFQRAVISTLVVATTTTLIPILGARPAGMISSAPIILSIMLPSTHRQSSAAGAAAMARGTIVSMAATVAFSAVLASLLPHVPIAPALLLAVAALCVLVAASSRLDWALDRLRPGLGHV